MPELMVVRLVAPLVDRWPGAEVPLVALAAVPMVLEAAVTRLVFSARAVAVPVPIERRDASRAA